MKFKIVYDRPGRLRLRAGAYAFDREYEARVHKACVGVPCVKSAVVHSANGGLLLEYESQNGDYGASRSQILEFAKSLNPKSLPECDGETEYQLQALDDEFKNNLAMMITRRYLLRWFVPLPIRTAITTIRGLRYVARGVSTLMSGNLTVDVLDGPGRFVIALQQRSANGGTVQYINSEVSAHER